MPKSLHLGLIAAAVMFFSPTPTQAQSAACVHLLVGAGYAAKMRVVSGDFSSDWSGTFAIGSTKCQSLDSISDGHTFSVEVKAIAGKTKTCTPSDVTRVASSTSSVTYEASGTTLKVKCQEPSAQATEGQATHKSTAPKAKGATSPADEHTTEPAQDDQGGAK